MKKSNKKITLTASSMAAIRFCQKMVALALGEARQIEQIEFTLKPAGPEHLQVNAVFTVFEPEDHKLTEYPQFMAAFSLVRFAHVRSGPAQWGISSSDEILACCNSPLGKARTTSHAEFRAVNPVELKLTKPFEFE